MTHTAYNSVISKNSRVNDKWAYSDAREVNQNAIVYVIDFGYNTQHIEFEHANIEDLNDTEVPYLHGTKVLSLIVGKTCGVSPATNVKFYNLTDANSMVNAFECILSLQSNNDNFGIITFPFQITDVNIVNNIKPIIDKLKKFNTVLVSSCGNDGQDAQWQYPATDPDTLVVGSHDSNGLISLFNSLSEDSIPDVFASGRQVRCASDNDIMQDDGTSLSTAIVAGSLSYYTSVDEFLNNCNNNMLCWKIDSLKNIKMKSCFIGKRSELDIPDIIRLSNKIGTIEVTNDIATGRLFLSTNEPDKTLHDCCVDAVKAVKQKNVIVPMSGGIDSEIVAITCLDANITFTPLIMKYMINNECVNEHDFCTAIEFCNKHDLIPQYIYLDIIDFYENGKFIEYSKLYYTNSPQLCTHLWMMDQIDGYFIFPGDPVSVQNGKLNSQPFMYYCYDYYLYKNNKQGISRLLSHTSDIVLSTASINSAPTNDSMYLTKVSLYQKSGFKVDARIKKYTGFENVKNYYNDKYNVLRVYDKRFRYILNDYIPDEFYFKYYME